MDRIGEHQDEMWDEEDGFFYDLLRLPDGQAMRLKVRSLVGLLPLCASTVFEADAVTRYPKLMEMLALFRKRHPGVASHVAPTDKGFVGYKGRHLLSILNKQKLQRVLAYMLDEKRVSRALRYSLAVALPPGPSIRLSRRRAGVQSPVPARGIEYRHVRRQLQLARPRVDANQCPARPCALEPVQLLRRGIQGRVSDGFGAVHVALRRGPRSSPAGWPPRSCATPADSGRCTEGPASSRTIRTGAT